LPFNDTLDGGEGANLRALSKGALPVPKANTFYAYLPVSGAQIKDHRRMLRDDQAANDAGDVNIFDRRAA